MLSPSITVVDTLLTQAFNETLKLDSYSERTGSLLIGKLPEDPEWLIMVRKRVAMLAEAGAGWTRDKPDIWGSVLLQFTDYASAFGGVAAMQQAGSITTPAQWRSLLSTVLVPQAKKAVAATDVATRGLQDHLHAFQNVQPLLEESINEGWAELSGEERQMVAIATELTHLEDLVSSLETSISSGMISSGQSIITSTAKTLYNVATAVGESFSFLSMAASAFTVGKTYYDLITNTEKIGETLRKIGELQLKASYAAQAAAGTKLVLRLVYDLQLTLGQIVDVTPQISTMWRTEQQKLEAAIAALDAGADPNTLFDLFSIPTANANWTAINRFALAIPALKTTVGPPVVLDPQTPMSFAA